MFFPAFVFFFLLVGEVFCLTRMKDYSILRLDRQRGVPRLVADRKDGHADRFWAIAFTLCVYDGNHKKGLDIKVILYT